MKIIFLLMASTAFALEVRQNELRKAVFPFSTGTYKCPPGWTHHRDSRGRYHVGVRPAGELSLTVGTILSNEENRAVGSHTHTAVVATHSHNNSYGTFETGGALLDRDNLTAAGTKATGSSSSGATIDNEGTVAGTNAPYRQLVVCIKE